MLSKDIFEASFVLLSHYPKRVSKEIANTLNWKTTHYSWFKQLLNSHPSPFDLHGGNFLPPQLTSLAPFQHINHCNFSRSLEISLKFSVNITSTEKLNHVQKYIATGRLDKVFVEYVTPNPTWISSLLLWCLFILDFINLSWQTWNRLFTL